MGLATESLITQVRHLLDGRLVIPSIQRSYVWKKAQVPFLLDSLYKDYPVGSLLVWKTTLDVPLKKAAVIQGHEVQLQPSVLLDGQQRLTSLAAVIAPDRTTTHLDVRFNIDTQEFLNASAVQRRNRRLLRVTQLMSETPQFAQLLSAAGIDRDDPTYDTYYDRIRNVHSIRQKEVPVVTVESDDYEEVAEIFTRVNQGGRRLSKGDLVLSAIAARWPDGLDVIDQFNDELNFQNFSLDREAVLRLTGILAGTGSHSIKLIDKAITGDKLKLHWAETEKALRYAVDFLKGECSIPRSAVLTSPNVVVIPAYLLFLRNGRLDRMEAATLKRWVYTAMAFSYYSNQVEGKLDADSKSLRSAVDSTSSFLDTLTGLVRRASGARPVDTPIDPEELSSKKMSSAWFNLLYIAALQRSVKDWKSNQSLSSAPMTSGSRIEYHHIFPKTKVTSTYGTDLTNSIGNLAFIFSSSNRSISAKSPAAYLPTIPPERLEEQQVPIDSTLWSIKNFPAFIEARQVGLARIFNQLLGLTVSTEASPHFTDVAPIEAELPDDDDEAFEADDALPRTDLTSSSSFHDQRDTLHPTSAFPLQPEPSHQPTGTRRPNGAGASHVLEVLRRVPIGTEFRIAEIRDHATTDYQAGEISGGAIDAAVRMGNVPGVRFVPGAKPKRIRLEE
ncbi:DUF262 domain-containing protein [Gordonia amarae]|uniref:DUF262 domain-containing protein n=1 Tax=Gordonia amarae TaxID=36821 RepID=UPI001AFCC3D6|nr:DUF262 domain-containing protein [Gordonia amarae]QHN29522.1 DUF262 domain-containing protein [Gordonia amarae]